MSMLTPPGMGRQYRVTGSKYPRMRRPKRRGRLVAAILASTATLGLVGWGALQLFDVFSGGEETASAGTRPCGKQSESKAAAGSRTDVHLPAPRTIKVNVLNATPRPGLAKSTADELRKRGFSIGEVGNATKEYDKRVPGTGLVLGPKSALNSALPVLGAQFKGSEKRTDGRHGTEVDLIIGTTFTRLAPKAEATKTLDHLAQPAPAAPKPTCS